MTSSGGKAAVLPVMPSGNLTRIGTGFRPTWPFLGWPVSEVGAREQSLLALRELWFLRLQAFCQRGKSSSAAQPVSAKQTTVAGNAARNQRFRDQTDMADSF